MSISDRESLARAIAEACLLRGTFVLRSGRVSSYYLDKYRFSTRPELLGAIGDLLREAIGRVEREAGREAQRLAGAELGGIPLVTVASLRTGLPCVFVRNQRKEYGTGQQLEGALEPGDGVLVIEDVATSGGQAVEAVGTLRSAGADPFAVIAVIDRGEGARERVEAEGVRFETLFTREDLGVEE